LDHPSLILRDDKGNDVSANRWYRHEYTVEATGVRQAAPPDGTRSFCRLLAADPATQGFVSKPTHFFSHAWRYEFREVVSAVGEYVFALPEGSPEPFFWYDCFSLDQHAQSAQGSDWWRTTFMDAIKSMGHTLMMLSPWNAPQPLTRAWCIWELYCTVKTGSGFSVCLGPSQDEALADALALPDGFDTVLQAFSTIDVEKSEAGNARDLEAILTSAATVEGGITGLNAVAVRKLREAVSTMALQAVERKLQAAMALQDAALQAGVSTADTATSELARTRHESIGRLLDVKANVARLMKELGRPAIAELMLRENLAANMQVRGPDHVATVGALNNLALVLQEQDQVGEASEMLETAYHTCLRTDGPRSASTMRQLNNLATAWEDMGRVQEAAALMQHALMQLQNLGDAPAQAELVQFTLCSVGNNLGCLLLRHGNLQQAASLIEQAHEAAVKLHGERHPSALTTMNSVADLRQTQGRYAEALQCYQTVCAGREVALGTEHASTCTARNNLATLYANCGQLDEAVALSRTVLDIRLRTLGEGHRDTLASLHNLGIMQSRRAGEDVRGIPVNFSLFMKQTLECISRDMLRANIRELKLKPISHSITRRLRRCFGRHLAGGSVRLVPHTPTR
jgi:tetratricopeptide (TPR) repeat protein